MSERVDFTLTPQGGMPAQKIPPTPKQETTQRVAQKVLGAEQPIAGLPIKKVQPVVPAQGTMPVGTPMVPIVEDDTVTIGSFSFKLDDDFAHTPQILEVLSKMDKKGVSTIQETLRKKSDLAKAKAGQSGGVVSDPYIGNLRVVQTWYHRRFEALKMLSQYQRSTDLLSTPYKERLLHSSVDSEIDMEWLATDSSTRAGFLACFDKVIASLDAVGRSVARLEEQREEEGKKDAEAYAISLEPFGEKLYAPGFDKKNFELLLLHGTTEQLNRLLQVFGQVIREQQAREGRTSLDVQPLSRSQKLVEFLSLRTGLEDYIKAKCSTSGSLLYACDFPDDLEMIYIRRHASDESRQLLIESFGLLREIVQENKAHFEGLKQPRVYISGS